MGTGRDETLDLWVRLSQAHDTLSARISERLEEAGETLEQRIAQEEPEPDPYEQAALDDEDTEVVSGEVGNVRAGRLVDEDQGLGPDVDSELIGEDVGIDGAGASAEEAAVHVIDDED